ncbi:MAG: tetratricopeptide repeat protein [Waddliaceae bacterium]
MKKFPELKKILQEILSTRNFDRLTPYAHSSQWKEMAKDDREFLGILFVMQGEARLNSGDSKVLESFQLANTIVPNSPLILLRQALAFATQSHNVFCLKAACKIFKKIVCIKNDFFDAWHSWGNTLVLLGIFCDKPKYYQKALVKFAQAEEFSKKVSCVKLSEFYRDWGECWYYLGKASGEPLDFRQSVRKFDDAIKKGMNTSDFWNGYGNSLMELSNLIMKPELFIEALQSYWLSVKMNPSGYLGWINFATTLSRLYQMYPQSSYFTLANDAFDQAVKIEPQHSSLWIKWGQLLVSKGKITRDEDLLREGCEKFEAGEICESNHPLGLSSWAEALMLIGSWTDDHSSLRQAQEKIIKCLEILPDQAHLWCLYGNCLNELGRYFYEGSHYLEAIEKFRYGLKLDSKDSLLWYGLAMSYFGLAQLRHDRQLMEEAVQLCVKAVECGEQSSPQFWNDWGFIFMALAQVTDEKHYIEEALNRFEQAIRLQTAAMQGSEEAFLDPEWIYNYGCAFEFLADYEESIPCYEKALKIFKRALEIDPAYYPVHYNIASILIQIGGLTTDIDCYYQAIDHLQLYVQEDSEDDHIWDEWGIALLNLAQIVNDPAHPDVVQKLFNEAESKLLQAVALGNTLSFYHLACLCSMRGNYADGMHYLERAKQHHALPCIDDLLDDKWLEGVRQTPSFHHFLSHLQKNHR